MLLQISAAGGMQKGTNGDESDERLRTENSYINNRHKHTIIATLSVKKGSKFTDPDAQFPRGGALACARGFPDHSLEMYALYLTYLIDKSLPNSQRKYICILNSKLCYIFIHTMSD